VARIVFGGFLKHLCPRFFIHLKISDFAMKQLYLSLLFCLFAGLMPGAQALPPEWITDEISGDPLIDDRFTVQSFAMGPDNTYHLVLERWDHEEINENGGFILYYMSKPCDGEWSEPELIHTLGESCVSPTIACDPDGRVFVCYQRYMPVDYWSDVIYVAERTEEGWVREEIPTPTPFENWMPQMSMDAYGKLHIAWAAKNPEACDDQSKRPQEDRKLYADKYARPDQGKGSCGDMVIAYSTNLSGEWETQIIKAPLGNFGLGAYPRLEVTPEGTAHMVFRGMDAESDPNFPVYRIYYATNLMPGGDIWELEMLQSEMLYDEEGFLVLHEDVVHVALGGSTAWEMPNYTFYLKRAEGEWTTPIRVNEMAFGYPTAIATDEDGNVYVTYISEAGQSYDGELFLWKKTDDTMEEISLVNEESLCANDFFFDLHGNMLVPYLTWSLKLTENPFFEHANVFENPGTDQGLPENPLVFDLNGNMHLITEVSAESRGTEETGKQLLYFFKELQAETWGLPDTLPTPMNRPVNQGTTVAAYSQDFEQPGLAIGYLSDEEGFKEGFQKIIPKMVIGEPKGAEWLFEDFPADLADAEPVRVFLEMDYLNRLHAAVFFMEILSGGAVVPRIHYGVKESGEWQIQTMDLPETASQVGMISEGSGSVSFVFSTEENEGHQIRFIRNSETGGTDWTEQSFTAAARIEKIRVKYLDPYHFVAVQTRTSEDSSSKVELFVVISGQEMLEPIAVSPDGLPNYELHSMDAVWGTVMISYVEDRNEGAANPLTLATLNEDFLSFTTLEIPAMDVYDSFLGIDAWDYYHIFTVQGETGAREVSEIFMGTAMELEQSSKFKLLRSGECMDFTYVEPPPAENGLSLFPNPARNQLKLRWDEAPGQDLQMAIYDLAGRLRREETLDAGLQAGEVILLDISGLEEGLYMVRLVSGNHIKTAKFLVR
jgi:hypothetical protein